MSILTVLAHSPALAVDGRPRSANVGQQVQARNTQANQLLSYQQPITQLNKAL